VQHGQLTRARPSAGYRGSTSPAGAFRALHTTETPFLEGDGAG